MFAATGEGAKKDLFVECADRVMLYLRSSCWLIDTFFEKLDF